MATRTAGAVPPLLLLLAAAFAAAFRDAAALARADFPSQFVFGAGTSAYQWEGAVAEDGRSPSIWDTFTHEGKMPDKSNGDVASDGYHHYKEDLKLIADTGLEAYRFSISWSRLIPSGRGVVNPKGLKFYNSVINELVKYGIQVHVTLYHLDLPQILEDEYGGWLSPKIVDDFTAYANVCFQEFGDRVTHWTTIAEPNVIAMASYDSGIWPPGRCSYPFGNCTVGDSTTEPYVALHHLLLAHASAVNLYKRKYQANQRGWIGINIYTIWCYPFSNSTADSEAAQRVTKFYVGWIADPLVYGDYPAVMKRNAGKRLPSFTTAQSEQLKGSFDFIGINHYASVYAADDSNRPVSSNQDYNADTFAKLSVSQNETPTGQFDPKKIHPDPDGLQYVLEYISKSYSSPPTYVQENGLGMESDSGLQDIKRVAYLKSFIGSTLSALRNGANLKGYFVWSFLDVYELVTGFQVTFGLYQVDFHDERRRRQQKLSAQWYSNFLKNNGTIRDQATELQSTLYTQ